MKIVSILFAFLLVFFANYVTSECVAAAKDDSESFALWEPQEEVKGEQYELKPIWKRYGRHGGWRGRIGGGYGGGWRGGKGGWYGDRWGEGRGGWYGGGSREGYGGRWGGHGRGHGWGGHEGWRYHHW